MQRFVSCLALLASLSGAQGCAYFQENPPLEARPPVEFVASDMPIPEGFRMDTRASWRHERSNFRTFKLLYRRAEYLSETRVREFFRERYPEAGWELVFLYGVDETQLVFKKDAEECLVRMSAVKQTDRMDLKCPHCRQTGRALEARASQLVAGVGDDAGIDDASSIGDVQGEQQRPPPGHFLIPSQTTGRQRAVRAPRRARRPAAVALSAGESNLGDGQPDDQEWQGDITMFGILILWYYILCYALV